jgi:hypothetical protein
VSITVSPSGLRKIAEALESLAHVEESTGIAADGGNIGNIYVTLAPVDPAVDGEQVRIVRCVKPNNAHLLDCYALEIEVP